MFDPNTARLADATERIATVVERIEKENFDSDRLADVLAIWDEWFNENENGIGAEAARDAMTKIGDILYRSKTA